MTQHFTVPEPLRSPNTLYAYIFLGVVLATAVFKEASWDLVRGYICIAAICNALLSAQVALVYTNIVYPGIPEKMRFVGNSPSAYWFGSLGMLLLGAGLVLGTISRAGESVPTPFGLPLIAIGVTVLAAWAWMVLRALHALGRELDG